jgi:hypothetical protein
MATIGPIGVGGKYASGATLGAYPKSNWLQSELPLVSGVAPKGSPTATGTVTAGTTITITGLADGTDYVITDSTGAFYISASTPKSSGADVSSTVAVNGISGTVSLPTGAATAANQDVATSFTNGRKTVTSAGTAEAIRATLACKWVAVTALPTNTQQVNIGGSGVLAASGTQTGVPLLPGDSVTLPVTDAATVFVDSRVNAEGVSFVVGS